jgi:ubiquinone/menaquinone biosynthesis C-methylase UbiE
MTTERVDPQDSITSFWNQRAGEYSTQPRHGLLDQRETAAWLGALTPLLPPAPADVLDVGTGTGPMARIYALMGHRVIGLDLAPGMLAEASAYCSDLPNPPVFRLGDANAPSLEAESVDAVTSRHVLWTLTDPSGALHNWRRLLRPGGRVLIIDALWFCARPSDQDEEPSDGANEFRKYYSDDVRAQLPVMKATSVADIEELVRSAGFVDVRSSDLRDVEALEDELYGKEGRDWPRYVVVGTKGQA